MVPLKKTTVLEKVFKKALNEFKFYRDRFVLEFSRRHKSTEKIDLVIINNYFQFLLFKQLQPDNIPFAVYVYGNSADNYIKRIEKHCHAEDLACVGVYNITPLYNASYTIRSNKAFLSLRYRIEAFLNQTGCSEINQIHMVNMLSNTGHKVILESIPKVGIKLYEDGLASYLTKKVAFSKNSFRRVSMGNQIENGHLTRVKEVFYLNDSLPLPKHFQNKITPPALEIDTLSEIKVSMPLFTTTRKYLSDIEREKLQRFYHTDGMNFKRNEVLLLLQNFSDYSTNKEHLNFSKEFKIYTNHISKLIESGFSVCIKPHPRKTDKIREALSNANNLDMEKVRLVEDIFHTIPAELMLNKEHLPVAIVGMFSSTLFYLQEIEHIPCYTTLGWDTLSIYEYCTRPIKEGYELAKIHLPSYNKLLMN